MILEDKIKVYAILAVVCLLLAAGLFVGRGNKKGSDIPGPNILDNDPDVGVNESANVSGYSLGFMNINMSMVGNYSYRLGYRVVDMDYFKEYTDLLAFERVQLNFTIRGFDGESNVSIVDESTMIYDLDIYAWEMDKGHNYSFRDNWSLESLELGLSAWGWEDIENGTYRWVILNRWEPIVVVL